MKIAVFPGSFDPFTKGHEDIVRKARPLFDKIIIAIGENSTKQSFYSKESRLNHLNSLYANDDKIELAFYHKLTVDFCLERNAQFIVRGLRDGKDFEYERSIAQMNGALNNKIESVFFMTNPEHGYINASIVREIAKNGGIIDSFVTNSHLLVIQ